MRFAGQVALVTGGAHGIGRATACRFANEGAAVVIADRDYGAAKLLADELTGHGRMAVAVDVDVTDAEACRHMIAVSTERFDRLDIVVANAGISAGDLVATMAPEEWDRVIAVNLTGVYHTCQVAIPTLIASGGGSIITMGSSMAGWDSSPTGAAYMASKEGVTGLTKSLALQLGRHGIRVNAVCPGVIKTRLNMAPGMTEEAWEARYDHFAQRIPLGRVGLPDDVAGVIAFLASADARHVTGAMVLIDGGQTLQSWSNAPQTETYPASGPW